MPHANRIAATAFGVLALVTLAACSSDRDVQLRQLYSADRSPDEFAVLPANELDIEGALALQALPEPSPGAGNRTDLTPQADAIAALGGNPRATSGTRDAALIAAAGEFGVDPNIRATLAEEDADLRRRRSLFSWQLFPEDQYIRAYRDQRLNAYFWLREYREAGVPTPSAPPAR